MAGPKTYTANYKSGKGRKNAVPEEDGYGHLQPQEPDLEKVVLGALMIEKDAYSLVSEILRPESFYEPRHQLIYEAIRKLNIEQKPVDILTVTDELKRSGHLEAVGGPFYITQLSGLVASAAILSITRESSHRNIWRVSLSLTRATSRQRRSTTRRMLTNLCRRLRESSLNFLSET